MINNFIFKKILIIMFNILKNENFLINLFITKKKQFQNIEIKKDINGKKKEC